MQLRYYGFENKFKKIGLDENKDYYNADHMNIYGKKKFTYYFINLLVKQYGLLSSSLKETEQEKWDLSFRYTEAFFEKYEDCVSKHQVKELYETYSLTKELDEKMNKKNSFMRNNHMFTNRKDYFVPIILKH